MWIDVGVTVLLALRLSMVRPTTPLLPESSDNDSSGVREDDEKNGRVVADRDVEDTAPFTEAPPSAKP